MGNIEVRTSLRETADTGTDNPKDTAEKQAEKTDDAEKRQRDLLLSKEPSVPADQIGWKHYLTKMVTDVGYSIGTPSQPSQADVDWAHWEAHEEKQAELARQEEAKRAELAAHIRDSVSRLLGGEIQDTLDTSDDM